MNSLLRVLSPPSSTPPDLAGALSPLPSVVCSRESVFSYVNYLPYQVRSLRIISGLLASL
jgi:hypothetical protein